MINDRTSLKDGDRLPHPSLPETDRSICPPPDAASPRERNFQKGRHAVPVLTPCPPHIDPTSIGPKDSFFSAFSVVTVNPLSSPLYLPATGTFFHPRLTFPSLFPASGDDDPSQGLVFIPDLPLIIQIRPNSLCRPVLCQQLILF